MLTAEPLAAFDVFGFLSLRGLFAPSETEEIRREFDDVLAEDRKGQHFTGAER